MVVEKGREGTGEAFERKDPKVTDRTSIVFDGKKGTTAPFDPLDDSAVADIVFDGKKGTTGPFDPHDDSKADSIDVDRGSPTTGHESGKEERS